MLFNLKKNSEKRCETIEINHMFMDVKSHRDCVKRLFFQFLYQTQSENFGNNRSLV